MGIDIDDVISNPIRYDNLTICKAIIYLASEITKESDKDYSIVAFSKEQKKWLGDSNETK